MPDDRDYGYLRLERQLRADRDWKAANLIPAIECVGEALERGSAASRKLLPHPANPTQPFADLCVDIDRGGIADINTSDAHNHDALVTAFLTFSRSANRKYEQLLASDLRALLNPEPHACEVARREDGSTVYYAMITEARLLQLYAAHRAGDHSPSAIPSVAFELPTKSHYTYARPLTDAMIDGDAVRAVCGVWFVPCHDHRRLPVCPDCERDLPVAKAVTNLSRRLSESSQTRQ